MSNCQTAIGQSQVACLCLKLVSQKVIVGASFKIVFVVLAPLAIHYLEETASVT
jgi:hypothetical protein